MLKKPIHFRYFYSPRKASHKSDVDIKGGGNIVKLFLVVLIVGILPSVETVYVEDGPVVLCSAETLYVEGGPIVLRSVEILYVVDGSIVVLRSVEILYVDELIEDKVGVEVDDDIDNTELIVEISLVTVIALVSSKVIPIVPTSVDTLCVEGPIVDKYGVEVDGEIECPGLIVDISLSIVISFVSCKVGAAVVTAIKVLPSIMKNAQVLYFYCSSNPPLDDTLCND